MELFNLGISMEISLNTVHDMESTLCVNDHQKKASEKSIWWPVRSVYVHRTGTAIYVHNVTVYTNLRWIAVWQRQLSKRRNCNMRTHNFNYLLQTVIVGERRESLWYEAAATAVSDIKLFWLHKLLYHGTNWRDEKSVCDRLCGCVCNFVYSIQQSFV